MRISITPFIVGAVSLASATTLGGCRKPAGDTAEAATADTAITDETENGTIAWTVTPEGQITASVKATDGRAITKDINGTLTWPGDLSDQQRDVGLDTRGSLVAAGPKLEDELTEIDYSLMIEGKPWNGVLHVPAGGTRAIEEDAKVAVAVPAGKFGPNGGTIQYIGGSPYELVADRDTQEVRVYMLDSDYGAIDPGERTFRLGWASASPGMEVLLREPGQDYYVGRWYSGFDPFRRHARRHLRRRDPRGHHRLALRRERALRRGRADGGLRGAAPLGAVGRGRRRRRLRHGDERALGRGRRGARPRGRRRRGGRRGPRRGRRGRRRARGWQHGRRARRCPGRWRRARRCRRRSSHRARACGRSRRACGWSRRACGRSRRARRSRGACALGARRPQRPCALGPVAFGPAQRAAGRRRQAALKMCPGKRRERREAREVDRGILCDFEGDRPTIRGASSFPGHILREKESRVGRGTLSGVPQGGGR